jgi:phosphatidylglycerophosphate synthase
MVCGIGAGVAFAMTGQGHGWDRLLWLAAAVLIQCRLLANLLDGMVAIESGRASRIGELFNEVPDRVSDTATIVGAGYAIGGDPIVGFIAACAAMFTAYVRTTGKAAGAPHEYCGPMAKQHRMALLTVVAIYCCLMPLALQPVLDRSGHGLMTVGLWLIVIGSLVTAIRRLLRIAAHLKGNPS